MKKEKRFSRSIALLVAILLTVTSAFSNYSFVNAAEDDVTTETQDSEKELVQCSDGWVIFKYKDENGEPQFDITYQDKTVEELEEEGYTMQYQVILKKKNQDFYESSWHFSYNGTISIGNYENEKEYLFVQFILCSSSSMVYSYVIPLYSKIDSSPYILSTNYGYLQIYDLTDNNPNIFKVEMKISEHLKETGDLSVSKRVSAGDINVEGIHTSNLTFKNCIEENTLEGITYTTKYSIVTFDLEIPSKYIYTSGTLDSAFFIYMFSFNGLVGLNSNNTIENLQFDVTTPAFLSEDVLVQSISINTSSSTVKAGDSVNLTANILPNNATNKTLNWSSSNSEYATVDQNGVVTAKPEGAGKTVTITATSTDGSNIKDSFTLTILPKEVLVKTIKITAASSSVKAGKAINLNASINSDATNKSIVWSSSNTKYATVDKNGIVTTKPAGAGKTVTITAKAIDGSNVSATFKLKIAKVPVSKIKLKAGNKSVKVGKKLKIKLTVNSDATNKDVKWSVSNKKYAKINSKGVLIAKKAGKGKTVKITAKAKDGSGKKATIKIKIKK